VTEASRFLIDAAVAEPHAGARWLPLAWWDVPGRLMFVLDLFERLERREREPKIAAGEMARTREPATA
jgi:hypothetical protein